MKKHFFDGITEFIFIENKPEPADLIFVPGGNYPQAAQKAAELYKKGYAPRILPSGRFSIVNGTFEREGYSTEWEYLKNVLIRNQVPETAILKEDQATYTYQNACYSRKCTDALGIPVKKAILCCQAFHARRCLMYYQEQFPDTEFLVCPVETRNIRKTNWFETGDGIRTVLGEVERCGTQFLELLESSLRKQEEKLKKIKLIACDIDGTLIEEGTHRLNPEYFEMIRALKERGILFVAASGRQYESMYSVFAPVADEIVFLAENGTHIKYQGKDLAYHELSPKLAREVVSYIQSKEDCLCMLSNPGTIYIKEGEKEFYRFLAEGYHNKVSCTGDFLSLCDKTNKISLYHKEGVQELIREAQKRFGDTMYVTQAGDPWIDFMPSSIDKGTGLKQIQEWFHVKKEETMAFGDNCNDIALLEQAGERYAVKNAHPLLKEHADHFAESYEKNGVLLAIRERILEREE